MLLVLQSVLSGLVAMITFKGFRVQGSGFRVKVQDLIKVTIIRDPFA